jgi:site-specific recombinase XerD
MNEYLKEIADLCGLNVILNTHKARRTFGSTVTLANDVPIHVVKEMLGHSSVKQTEEYAITEQQTVGRQMMELRNKLNKKASFDSDNCLLILAELENEILSLKKKIAVETEKIGAKISLE